MSESQEEMLEELKTTEEVLEELETPEGQKKLSKWIEEYNEKERIKSENIKVLMSNTDYIEWLNEFTKDKEAFSDDLLFFPERVKDSDKENIKKLDLFYEGINKYAKKNYIYSTPYDFGDFYKIRLNKIGFEIGILIGQGTVIFCKKVPVKNEQEFIDFNDIMIGKKQENVDQINASLNSLSKMILTAYESGVPIEAIYYTLENIIKEIASKKENDSEILLTRKF